MTTNGGTDWLTADAALELAEAALAMCHGDAAQVTVDVERSVLHRFALSRLIQATSNHEAGLEVVVTRGSGRGAASTTDLAPEGVARAVRRATVLAAHAVSGQQALPLVSGDVGPAVNSDAGFDGATAALDVSPGHAALATLVAESHKVGAEAFGLWSTAATGLALADSSGRRAFHRRTDARMKCVCKAGDACGFAAQLCSAVSVLAPEDLARQAAAFAFMARRQARLPPGTYQVVLAPAATAFLLAMLGSMCANGLAHSEGRGSFSGRLNDRVAAPCVSLIDDAIGGDTLPRAFDLEGTPTRTVTLIDNGVATAVVHDRRSAQLAGTVSTGHAAAPGGDPDGPKAGNLALSAGLAASAEELIGGIEFGLFVTRFWYGDVLDARSALMTAMTRDGVFLIERGKIVSGVRPMRLTDSVLAILSSVDSLTRDRALIGEEHLIGRRIGQSGVRAPAIRAGRARFV
jgi:predicted Zn-dependent protease